MTGCVFKKYLVKNKKKYFNIDNLMYLDMSVCDSRDNSQGGPVNINKYQYC